MIEQSRRGFITGLIAFAATAPAIVRAGSLMPVKQMAALPFTIDGVEVRIGQAFYFQNRIFWLAGIDQTVCYSGYAPRRWGADVRSVE